MELLGEGRGGEKKRTEVRKTYIGVKGPCE